MSEPARLRSVEALDSFTTPVVLRERDRFSQAERLVGAQLHVTVEVFRRVAILIDRGNIEEEFLVDSLQRPTGDVQTRRSVSLDPDARQIVEFAPSDGEVAVQLRQPRKEERQEQVTHGIGRCLDLPPLNLDYVTLLQSFSSRYFKDATLAISHGCDEMRRSVVMSLRQWLSEFDVQRDAKTAAGGGNVVRSARVGRLPGLSRAPVVAGKRKLPAVHE